MKNNILEVIRLTEKEQKLLDQLMGNGCEPINSYLRSKLCHKPKHCREAIELFKEFREFSTIHRTAGGYTPRCIYDILNKDSAYRDYIEEVL